MIKKMKNKTSKIVKKKTISKTSARKNQTPEFRATMATFFRRENTQMKIAQKILSKLFQPWNLEVISRRELDGEKKKFLYWSHWAIKLGNISGCFLKSIGLQKV